MTPINPSVANTSSAAPTTNSPASPQSTPSNTLGPNSFITLLTAQLRAQDPLSPMDPDQMVNELTSINTLQQLVQIRSDMDTLVNALPAGQGSNSGGAGGGTAPSLPSTNAASQAAKLLSQKNSSSKFI